MNLELLESFGQNYPEDFDGTLDCVSIAITCAFNRQGTLLAVGCNDGRLVFWDFLTRGIAKIINAHVHPVCTLSWSRNGQKLLSAATDNTVSLWNVRLGEVEKTFRFPSPILKVQFHPRSSEKFLVCPMKHAAVAMNMEGPHKIVPLDEDSQQKSDKLKSVSSGKYAESDLNIVASYDRRGKYIYTGNARGRVCVFTEDTHKLKASFRITTGTLNTTTIKSLEFARRGNCFLVNSADRIIRVYETGEVLACGKDGEPEPIQKLQDLVNKTLWKKCCFSGDGEYIVAGSAKQHSLYIWENSVGNSVVKILHGTKGEMLLDVTWHPVRPIIASISSGVVSIWAQNQVENWSAFAPDFKELDENVEYDERESEFDLEEEGKEKQDFKETDEDIEVDVTTIEPIQAFVSSDEEEEDKDCLLYLPVSPDIEEPEEGWNVMDQSVERFHGQNNASGDNQTRPSKSGKIRTGSSGKYTEQQQGSEDAPASISEKRKSQLQGSDSTKKRKVKTLDVDLENAPMDEIHPLLNVKKPNEKASKKPSTKTKQKSGKSDRSKHKAD